MSPIFMLVPLTLDHTPGFTLIGMRIVVHIPAQPDVPIACDMSSARDTPEERLGEYGRLFERALVRRERRGDGVLFAFRANGGTRQAIEDLARREAACCPFLDYRVETVGNELIWTTSNPATGDARVSADVILNVFHALPDEAGSDVEGLLGRLAERGVRVIEGNGQRSKLRRSAAG